MKDSNKVGSDDFSPRVMADGFVLDAALRILTPEQREKLYHDLTALAADLSSLWSSSSSSSSDFQQGIIDCLNIRALRLWSPGKHFS